MKPRCTLCALDSQLCLKEPDDLSFPFMYTYAQQIMRERVGFARAGGRERAKVIDGWTCTDGGVFAEASERERGRLLPASLSLLRSATRPSSPNRIIWHSLSLCCEQRRALSQGAHPAVRQVAHTPASKGQICLRCHRQLVIWLCKAYWAREYWFIPTIKSPEFNFFNSWAINLTCFLRFGQCLEFQTLRKYS